MRGAKRRRRVGLLKIVWLIAGSLFFSLRRLYMYDSVSRYLTPGSYVKFRVALATTHRKYQYRADTWGESRRPGGSTICILVGGLQQ